MNAEAILVSAKQRPLDRAQLGLLADVLRGGGWKPGAFIGTGLVRPLVFLLAHRDFVRDAVAARPEPGQALFLRFGEGVDEGNLRAAEEACSALFPAHRTVSLQSFGLGRGMRLEVVTGDAT